MLLTCAQAVALAAVALAPLALGTVHRSSIVATFATVAAASLLSLGALALGRRPMAGLGILAPLAMFVALTALQLVPLPFAVRVGVDPHAAAIFAALPGAPPSAFPISFDPTATLFEMGRAAAALAVALIAASAASRRPRRPILPLVIAVSGLSALAIGLGHHVFGTVAVYGQYPTISPILIGPFINPNHTAEFLELASACALAVALGRSGLARLSWMAASALLAASAITTLSRGSLLALTVGAAVVFIARPRADEPTNDAQTRRRHVLLALVAVLTVLGLAFALGADAIVRRFDGASVSDAKTRAWFDAARITLMHPLGIGRGAFSSVYPVYQRLEADATYAFVENGPLQLLLDFGWISFIALVAVSARAAWQFFRRRSGSAAEAALLGGLTAVMVHNLVDFGLETMGVRLPFAAVLGYVVGRAVGPQRRGARLARSVATSALALGALVATLVMSATANHRDFDDLVQAAPSTEALRPLTVAAAYRHPADSYFPFAQSFSEPLVSPDGRSSPRLGALNRTMQLCPICSEPHAKAADTLWKLHRRRQAISEWTAFLQHKPEATRGIADRLDSDGATPAEIASLGAPNEDARFALVDKLTEKKARVEASAVVDEARALGAPPWRIALAQASLERTTGSLALARTFVQAALAGAPPNGLVHLELARIQRAEGDLAGAYKSAHAASLLQPNDLVSARLMVDLAIAMSSSEAFESALATLRAALAQNGQSTVEAAMVSARFYAALGNLPRAYTQYRLALTLEPQHAERWSEFALFAERNGSWLTALEAYQGWLNTEPGSKVAAEAIARLHRDRMVQEMLQDMNRPAPR